LRSSSSTTPTSPNAIARGGSPHAGDADSRSGSHSDVESGQKPSLTTKVAKTPSLPAAVPPRSDAQLRGDLGALAVILLRAPNRQAAEIGQTLAEISRACARSGVDAGRRQQLEDVCLTLSALVWGPEGIGLETAEHRKFEGLVDAVFAACIQPAGAQGGDDSPSRIEAGEVDSPSKRRTKRKVRSGESPGSEGADRKKPKNDKIEISTPKLVSPYPAKPASAGANTTASGTATTATTSTTTTTVTTTSAGVDNGSSQAANIDSPPISPRRGSIGSGPLVPTSPTGDSAALISRIATNLTTLATQFNDLCEFGHAIDRSKWSGLPLAREIVGSLMATAGSSEAQLARTNEFDKLARAVTSLSTALQSAQRDAAEVKHAQFDLAGFQKHAKRMSRLLQSIQLKVADLLQASGNPLSPHASNPVSAPVDALARVRASSGGASHKPSLSTFGRKSGKSIFQSASQGAPTSPHAEAPTSPRSARKSMLVSIPVANFKANREAASTAALAPAASSFSAQPAVGTAAQPLAPAVAPLSQPTSRRPQLKLQPQPQRLRLRPEVASAQAGEPDSSIVQLKAALGKLSSRNLLRGYAVEGDTVMATNSAWSSSTTATSGASAEATSAATNNPANTASSLRALLSGSSARNLLQRFRVEGANVVPGESAQTAARTSLPTQASGDLTDADIEELVKKVENGSAELIDMMLESLTSLEDDQGAAPAQSQSLDDTVILSASSDEEAGDPVDDLSNSDQ
jgi:hypothetical protein